MSEDGLWPKAVYIKGNSTDSTHQYVKVVKEVLRSFTEVKVAVPQYQNNVLYFIFYLSKSTNVLQSKYNI